MSGIVGGPGGLGVVVREIGLGGMDFEDNKPEDAVYLQIAGFRESTCWSLTARAGFCRQRKNYFCFVVLKLKCIVFLRHLTKFRSKSRSGVAPEIGYSSLPTIDNEAQFNIIF